MNSDKNLFPLIRHPLVNNYQQSNSNPLIEFYVFPLNFTWHTKYTMVHDHIQRLVSNKAINDNIVKLWQEEMNQTRSNPLFV